MTRQDLLLCILAAGGGRAYTPVQLQKAAFLVTRNLPSIVDAEQRYDFVPYDYGPFDRNVYGDANSLAVNGRALIAPTAGGRWNTYAATPLGLTSGNELLTRLYPQYRTYIEQVCQWVLGQSFGSLVKSIYDHYPEMKQNSIFQG